MSTVDARTYTPADLLAMPDSSGVELVNGTLVEKPMSALSAFVEVKVSRKLDAFCDTNDAGVVFSSTNGIQCFPDHPHKVRKPDVTYFKRQRFTAEHFAEGFVTIPPDLAVEVVSTHDEAADLNEKVEEYLAAGIPLVWVIDPETRIAFIHRRDGSVTKLHANDTLTGEDILPGFSCRVGDLFPNVPSA